MKGAAARGIAGFSIRRSVPKQTDPGHARRAFAGCSGSPPRLEVNTIGGADIDDDPLAHGPDSHVPCEPVILKGTRNVRLGSLIARTQHDCVDYLPPAYCSLVPAADAERSQTILKTLKTS
jgi:hypothetical protein